jgi:hypothetical protein
MLQLPNQGLRKWKKKNKGSNISRHCAFKCHMLPVFRRDHLCTAVIFTTTVVQWRWNIANLRLSVSGTCNLFFFKIVTHNVQCNLRFFLSLILYRRIVQLYFCVVMFTFFHPCLAWSSVVDPNSFFSDSDSDPQSIFFGFGFEFGFGYGFGFLD